MSAPHIAGFMDRMNEAGLTWDDSRFSEPVDDGILHRYDVEGDRKKSFNGWYILHGGQYPAGCFGSWRTGDRFSWSMKDCRTLSSTELETIRRDREQRQRNIDSKLDIARQEACNTCLHIWTKAKPPDPSHPYLMKKQVGIYGIRQYRNNLLIPVLASSGKLYSLQFIDPSGKKTFKSGGRVKGCFHRIGKPKERTVYIAEGYATAATVHEQTGHAVAAAFNAGNLIDVALALHSEYPNYRLFICADNDRLTEGNPGLTQARRAAQLTGAGLLIPTFADDEPGSDFNDRYLLDRDAELSHD